MNDKHLIIFMDCGDTIVDESTQVRDEKGVVLTASVIQGADIAIKTLYEAGYTLVLVADGMARSFQNILSYNKLDQYFSALICSDLIKHDKPDKRMFLAALGAIGLSKNDVDRVIMVGNNLSRDVKGANELGIGSVFLDWSPRYPVKPADESEKPTYVIKRPMELIGLAERLNNLLT